MPTYIIEINDSDGNDCHVYDVVVSAPSRADALATVWRWINEEYPEDEPDGNGGTYHPCDCATSDDEDSHGGLLVDTEGIAEFPDVQTAMSQRRYHTLIDLTWESDQ